MKLNQLIDHTLLKPCSKQALEQLCSEAVSFNFASVCVLPANLEFIKERLTGSMVKTCAVVGFPLGENTTETKIYEALELCKKDVDELDVVINLSWGLRGEWHLVADELRRLVSAVNGKALVKVIVESCLWNEAALVYATNAVIASGAEFIKTSTGFNYGGATTEAINLMVKTIDGGKLQIKASGGIRTREQAELMVKAGASRIGTSCGIQICTEK